MPRKGAARSKAQATAAATSGNDGGAAHSVSVTSDTRPSKRARNASNHVDVNDAHWAERATLMGLSLPALRTVATYVYARRALTLVWVALAMWGLWMAYDIRMISVRTYGYLIHEFDPWFNFRAAQYMDEHGWHAFFHWFDTMSWYPIGRHVGATAYPGMQFTAVALHRVLDAVGVHMSLNDICVLIPVWFGVVATVIVGAITHETTASLAATALAMSSFAIIPAHTMRSMGGEFDNECIAMSAMLLTFYVWMRALRTPRSWPVGLLAGVAYGYMVAVWGGFIFVLNMVALHASVCAAVDWLRNTYSASLLYAYSLFFVVGTALAVRVPPVGMSPFKSLEQISAIIVFVALWTLHVSELLRRRARVPVRSMATLQLRMRVLSIMLVAIVAVAVVLAPSNYFGPITMRVRALFVQHTRTGNPLVDSVAEHQPASATAYMQFLHIYYLLWLCGTLVLPFTNARNTRAAIFVLLYSFAAYYFSTRMARLMIFAGPVACVCGANVVRHVIDFVVNYAYWPPSSSEGSSNGSGGGSGSISDDSGEGDKSHKNDGKSGGTAPVARAAKDRGGDKWQGSILPMQLHKMLQIRREHRMPFVAVSLVVVLVVVSVILSLSFVSQARMVARAMGSPRIVVLARSAKTGEPVLIDDYLQSYLWLRNNTPEDARVLSWWDYGYQITGIANRTTLADGNTWHHEHIATVGKMLVAPVAEAHSLIRHVADYVLIWAGQNAEDLMKSHHMVHIGNSVYHDICQGDPLCRNFGMIQTGRRGYEMPTPRMRESLLYHLHGYGRIPDIHLDPHLFREVYTSANGLVRIYKVMNVSQESKAWIADPANRICRPPPYPEWCEGQFPPAPELQAMLAHRVNYGQQPTPEQLRSLREFHASAPSPQSQYMWQQHQQHQQQQQSQQGRRHQRSSKANVSNADSKREHG